ncbi:ArdC-like ssDNA-binding domain-containing protein [Plantactinospora sp. CA-290183]|uniref:ArdC-like ssDNA-binding domain-containing protein n=1 Tax=Plantactinospora sp. CA-290183 TaxID=3240006 RepID=UPI003D901F05
MPAGRLGLRGPSLPAARRRGQEATMAKKETEEHTELLAKIKADFDDRLARLAADPQQWIEFVERAAVFGARYTLTNQILLMVQAHERGIEPRYFLSYGNRAGTSGWRARGRQVRLDEQAFKVWAPVRRRPTEEQAQEWEAAGRTVKRDDKGRPAVQVVGFQLISVFELSQTDGEPFEPPTVQRVRRMKVAGGQLPRLLTGDDPTGAYDDLVKLIKDEGYAFELAPARSGYLGTANGVTVTGPTTRLVQVREDVDPAQRVKTTAHELAHIRCEHTAGTRLGEDLHRGRKETEAESVAHLVCKALGLDTHVYSDAYVLGWANGDLNLIRECAETILRVSKKILFDLTPADADSSAVAETGLDVGSQPA